MIKNKEDIGIDYITVKLDLHMMCIALKKMFVCVSRNKSRLLKKFG